MLIRKVIRCRNQSTSIWTFSAYYVTTTSWSQITISVRRFDSLRITVSGHFSVNWHITYFSPPHTHKTPRSVVLYLCIWKQIQVRGNIVVCEAKRYVLNFISWNKLNDTNHKSESKRKTQTCSLLLLCL